MTPEASPAQDALLLKLFAEFLLARQRLLASFDYNSEQPLHAALRATSVCFLELAQQMLPHTPEDILIALTKNIVLNACRAGCLANDDSIEGEGRQARIVEFLASEASAHMPMENMRSRS